jgi:hypothetical protein
MMMMMCMKKKIEATMLQEASKKNIENNKHLISTRTVDCH